MFNCDKKNSLNANAFSGLTAIDPAILVNGVMNYFLMVEVCPLI